MNIVICATTYFRLSLTRQWLTSILKYFPEDAILLIADNGSKDGTKEYLESLKENKKIGLIKLFDKNIGKAKAMNYLFAEAKKKYNPRFLVSSDNDIVICKDWDKILIEVFEYWSKKKKMGWVAPIYEEDNCPMPESKARTIKLANERGAGFWDKGGLAGGFFLMPIELYDHLGGYCIDNVYGGVDGSYLHLCRKNKYHCGCTPKCVMRHLCGGKEFEKYEEWKFQKQKELKAYMKKHGNFDFKIDKGFFD